MSAPRLPFLWPALFRPVKYTRSSPSRVLSRNKSVARNLSVTTKREQGTTKRYGTAQEPAEHLRDSQSRKIQGEQQDKAASVPEKKTEPIEEEEDGEESTPATTKSSVRANTAESIDPPPKAKVPEPPRTPEPKPLETILHMPSPAEEEQRKSPHLKTPPYVHHFDTFGLVKRLTQSGFTQEQSVIIMKGVRGTLMTNMELAREGLVSKSNVENETYLFRAACSELRTEIENKRKGEVEQMRSERNQLQHELDILNQKLGQETSHLKDELKGLFDDRKMAVRQEQRIMETKIQELNYKITVALNSDSRSEVEGLRWVLTRRAAITVGSAAVMLFLALKASSAATHSEEKKKAKESKPSSEDQSKPDPADFRTSNNQDAIGGEILATEGGVSLA